MKFKIIIIFLAVLFLTSGCWNYRELTDMSIVGSIGIDYDVNTNMILMTAQIFNPKKSSDGTSSAVSADESPTTIYKQEAHTIHEALRKMIEFSPHKLYIGHLEVIVISEEVAKNHLKECLDFLFRDPESRKDFIGIISKGSTPFEVQQILTPMETITASNIYQKITSNDKNLSTSVNITYDEFISMNLQEGIDPVLPVVKIMKGDESDNTNNVDTTYSTSNLIVSEIAVFKGHKLVGYLNDIESEGYNIIHNKMKESVLSFPCDDKGNYAGLEIITSKTKLKLNKKNEANINVKITGALSELNCSVNISKSKNILKLEKYAKKMIEEMLTQTSNKLQKEFNSDALGYGKYLYHNEYEYWNKIKDKWDEIYPNVKTKFKIEVILEKKGSTITSIMEKIND